MSQQAEQFIAEIHGALFNRVPSQSIYAEPGEGPRWQLHELIKNDDGFEHQRDTEDAARLGDSDALRRVARTAAGQGNVRTPGAVTRARGVLAEIEADNPAILQAYLGAK